MPFEAETQEKADEILAAYTKSLQDAAREQQELRDVFAAFALNGIITLGQYRQAGDCAADKVAKDAYWYADAIMAERERRN